MDNFVLIKELINEIKHLQTYSLRLIFKQKAESTTDESYPQGIENHFAPLYVG